MMRMTDRVIDTEGLFGELKDAGAGACVTFEGWIRNENEGHDVLRLEYEAYVPLCLSEGGRIIELALQDYPVLQARCIHRTGLLEIGECAVWVGVSSPHRSEAFDACRFIIDEIKVRLPIWKKEHYRNGDSGWVNCERCASHGLRATDAVAVAGAGD